MSSLITEVDRFRAWADDAYPALPRYGEWECEYEQWGALYTAVLAFVAAKPFAAWSPAELSSVLYVIARDNEMQHLTRELRERHAEALIELADASLRLGEAEARWQFAYELGRMALASPRRHELLLAFAKDADEYVRRRSLGSLARIGSPLTESLALEAWAHPDESQQWSRMMALWALHRIGSSHLERLLLEAERDESPYLSGYAAKIRSGDVDP